MFPHAEVAPNRGMGLARQITHWGLVVLLVVLVVSLPGCRKKDWVPPEKKPVYKAEIDNLWPKHDAIRFKKLNDFPWKNVVFTLNKEYIFSVTEVEQGQIEFFIKFEQFRHKKTGVAFDPEKEDVWRIWIEGDEGYWY